MSNIAMGFYRFVNIIVMLGWVRNSYDGGGSNCHRSFDLGNQESNRKQPLPNLKSMLQVDYNFIDVQYQYMGFHRYVKIIRIWG